MSSSHLIQGPPAGPLPIQQPFGLTIALLLPFAAAATQWLLWQYIQPLAWLLFYPVICFAPLLGGRRGGLGATFISALCGWYLFVPPQLTWGFEHRSGLASALMFVVAGVAFSLYHQRFMHLQTLAARAHGEQRFGATYNQTLVGIAETDSAGRLTTVNDRYCEITGYPREELLGKRMHDITHPDDLPRNIELFERMREANIPFMIEKRYLSKSGAEIWVNNSVSPLFDANGRQTGGFALVLDITKRKRLEREIRKQRREQRELLNRLIASQTTSVIADKLNQPLQAITAYNEAALRMMQAGNPNPEKLRHAIETSEQQARRAGYSIRNFLETLNDHELSAEPIDLNREIHNAMAAIRVEYDFPFDTILNLAADLPLVLCNRIRLRKVLINLLSNGIEALQTAASPCPALIVSTCQGNGVAEATIQDNGPGIAPQDRPHLFTPFFTTKANSFGMGLSISRFLIESNGGQIWIDPATGPGTTFHLTVPIAT
ncbi:hypothetical protein B9N43_07275 [Denitratisoma sp. DHT3]|uniref:PAS domain S-box protein n=1 Tax=Denitratisoma sp. DHT3 TaxID=1981880 RepID=UPI001198C795|nr:PAS domain S-box protein [Denitratisoma sp. DHT3]QDX81063.1 hypothetical protein B9N43_07275 [Denitratisoma sp. DHT3]